MLVQWTVVHSLVAPTMSKVCVYNILNRNIHVHMRITYYLYYVVCVLSWGWFPGRRCTVYLSETSLPYGVAQHPRVLKDICEHFSCGQRRRHLVRTILLGPRTGLFLWRYIALWIRGFLAGSSPGFAFRRHRSTFLLFGAHLPSFETT